MKPIKANDILELDKNLEVQVLQCYPIPEQVIYQAAKNDYSEIPIHKQEIPLPSECGKWIVDRLLSNERGEWGPCEHPHITFSISGYVHSVMVQARTHRVGISFDCLAGESKITVKNKNEVKTETISDLYKMYKRNGELPLVRNLNENTGHFDYAKIGKVFKNEEKRIYLVRLEDNKELKCSMDHRIFTENGWKRLKDLTVGDKVACNGVSLVTENISQASENENHKVLCSNCHCQEHRTLKTHYVPISFIKYLRTDITYDIEVDGTYHNFVCDGVVVHNCQSQRYTGKRVLKVASGELNVEDVFYVRPTGFYVNRHGKKYDWSEENRQQKIQRILDSCVDYANDYVNGGICEEHIRDYLPQAIRQNFVMTVNLRSMLHMIDLRAKLDAQLEIQAMCAQISPLLKNWAPNVWKYYEEKRLHRAKLSP